MNLTPSGKSKQIKRSLEKYEQQIFWVLLLAVPLLIVIGIEIIQRGGTAQTIEWIWLNKISFSLNYTIIFFLYLFFLALTGCQYLSLTILSCFGVLIAGINIYKIRFLGEPFFPWDIQLYKQLANLWPYVSKETNAVYFVALLIPLLILKLLRSKLPSVAIKPKVRLLLGVTALLFLVSMAFSRTSPMHAFLDLLDVKNNVFQQKLNYQRNGVVLSFALNFENAVVLPPRNYSQQQVSQVLKQLKSQFSNTATAPDSSIRPDIVVIMNEAFWDPTRIQTVKFSSDPLPTVHDFESKDSLGTLLSPEFGGNTANVEFEVLTGLSTSFLPRGSVAYQQYVKKPLPSLVSLLAEKGYRTTAIHPYDKWYWNRDTVYPYLGFQRFISKSELLQPVYKGFFIADQEVAQTIIAETQNTAQPNFIFAVTMQNHGPYNDNRYQKNKIRVDAKVTGESLRSLNTYSQGAADADQSLAMLIEHFSKVKRPTLLVFFGDHLPYLGKNYAAYAEAGYIKTPESDKWSGEEQEQMSSVPLVMWSNYNAVKPPATAISASFLAPYILESVGISQPLYYQYLKDFRQKLPGFQVNLKIDAQGNKFRETPLQYREMEDRYWLLEYDLLFGQQYGRREGMEIATAEK